MMRTQVLFILFILGNCSPAATFKAKDHKHNFYQKASIAEVAKNPDLYHNKPIELDGYFYHGLEHTSISEKKYSETKQSIWVDFNFFKDLLNKDNEKLFEGNKLEKFSGKKVRIKGVFTKDKTGHLNQYSGSITEITYFEG